MYDLLKRNGMSIANRHNDFLSEFTKSFEKAWYPFKKEDDRYMIEIDVPGFGKDDIDIQISDNIMSLKGEKGKRIVDYSVEIPEKTDYTKGEATIKDGVLKVVLPVAESSKPRQITIKEE